MIALYDALLFALGYIASACYALVISLQPDWTLPITIVTSAALIAGLFLADCVYNLRKGDTHGESEQQSQ